MATGKTIFAAGVVVATNAQKKPQTRSGSRCRVDDVLLHHRRRIEHECCLEHRRSRLGRESWPEPCHFENLRRLHLATNFPPNVNLFTSGAHVLLSCRWFQIDVTTSLGVRNLFTGARVHSDFPVSTSLSSLSLSLLPVFSMLHVADREYSVPPSQSAILRTVSFNWCCVRLGVSHCGATIGTN